MFFTATPPDMSAFLRGGTNWTIFAEGEVELSDGDTLHTLIAENSIPRGSDLYLHSGGGSLIGGINLGRVIRSYALNTHVGQRGEFENGFQFASDGHCMSAAAIAFLGGQYRFIGPQSIFGVHRFSLNDPTEDGVEEAQVIAASVVEYINSMGISTELFSLASETHAADMLEIPAQTLRKLNIANDGFQPTTWTIESIEGCVYLKGARETIYGMQKFLMLFPSKGAMTFYVIFDGGDRADEFLSMQSDRLEIDNEHVELSGLRVYRISDFGRINAMYKLTPEILYKLKNAKQIGYILQHSADAPLFVGFNMFPFEEASTKLPGLISLFNRSSSE